MEVPVQPTGAAEVHQEVAEVTDLPEVAVRVEVAVRALLPEAHRVAVQEEDKKQPKNTIMKKNINTPFYGGHGFPCSNPGRYRTL